MQPLRTMLLLAQDPASTVDGVTRSWETWNLNDSMKLITIIGLLIVAVVGGGFVLTYLRRKMVAKESAMAGTGSLMDELRRLRKEGVLSEAEYEASRRAATAGIRGVAPGKGESGDPRRGGGSTHAGHRAAPAPVRAPRPPIKPLESDGPGPGTDRGLQARPGFDLTGAPLPPRTPDDKKRLD